MNPGFWRTERGRLIRDFLGYETAEKGIAAATQEHYTDTLRRFCIWGRGRSGSVLTTKEHHVRKYLAKLRASRLDDRTVASHISTLRGFFLYLQRERLMRYDPMIRIDRPKTWKTLPRHISEAEAKALLDSMPPEPHSNYQRALALRNQAICEVFYASGIRLSELTGLKCLDVKLDERTVMVFGKGSKERLALLGLPAMDALRQYLWEGRPLFKAATQSPFAFTSSHGARMSKAQVEKVLAATAERAQIRHLSAHMLRHSCATHMLQNGADLRTIQEVLGHADISNTEIYTHVSTAHLKKATALHPRAQRQPEAVAIPSRNVCIECAAPVCPENRIHCLKHHLANRERVKRHNFNRTAQGICRNCMEPVEAPSRHFCAIHREQQNARNRASRQRRRAQKAQRAAA